MNTEQERAAFEAWANGRCELHLVNPAGKYSSAITQFAWEAYQAGQAALEAAREDAERYRLLRRKVCIAGGEFHILNLGPRYIAPDAAVELDAAIDAALAKVGAA